MANAKPSENCHRAHLLIMMHGKSSRRLRFSSRRQIEGLSAIAELSKHAISLKRGKGKY